MKTTIYDLKNSKAGEKDLPSQFNEAYRPDLIKRAVLVLQSAARQAYGTSPEAGKRSSSDTSKRRRKYRGTYGFGISRVNRKIHSRRGMRMNWVGAFSPQTVGGRRSHPPKADKILEQKINKKENRKAIRSAIAAAMDKEIVMARGHRIPENYPFIISSDFENLVKTKEIEAALVALGFSEEIKRSLIRKVRAGLGKMRGRKYQTKKGLMIVVSGQCPLMKAASNLNVDVVIANALNAELLAPGAQPGRATLWTEKAIDMLNEKKLFL